ncbi:response regulator [Desulfovermiculus halophilus]|jgi:PleD family two-component response regulator|uniref:response regulator n=1 Tax=Desulfovermiculus halophilus TaxID=339722 RepID=UPI000487C4FC|nr:response regulator [Desulfovermiculus halophilus]
MQTSQAEHWAVLLLDPDDGHAGHVRELLEAQGLEVVWVKRHLSGLSALDEQDFSLVLASVEGQDVDGLEFCSLLARRQERRSKGVPLVLLMGRERHREALAATDPAGKDYLVEPCLDAEIVWRVMHNLPGRGKASAEGGFADWILTSRELASVLDQEVSRSSRNSDGFGLVMIKLTGWPLLSMDYGPAGALVVEDIIVRRIQDLVRVYDRLFRIEQGRFAVLLPQASLDGIRGFMHRIYSALSHILHTEAFAQDELEALCIQGLRVQTDRCSRPHARSVRELHRFILNQARSEPNRPGLVQVTLNADGLTLDHEIGRDVES